MWPGDVCDLAGMPEWSQQGLLFPCEELARVAFPASACGLCWLGVGRGENKGRLKWCWHAGAWWLASLCPTSLNLLPSVTLTWFKGGEETTHQLVWKTFFFPEVRDCEEFKKAFNHLLRSDTVLKGIKTK